MILTSSPDESALQEVQAVLRAQRLVYRTAPADAHALTALAEAPRALVLLVGGPVTAQMRALVGQLTTRVPGAAAAPSVVVLAEGVTDSSERDLLERGARDVLAAPVRTERLTSRVLAAWRAAVAAWPEDGERLRVGLIDIHVGRREVWVDQAPVDLTKTEFDLLLALARRPRHVVSRAELADLAMGGGAPSSRALESHVSRLRSKIRRVGDQRVVESVRGVGYRLSVR